MQIFVAPHGQHVHAYCLYHKKEEENKENKKKTKAMGKNEG